MEQQKTRGKTDKVMTYFVDGRVKPELFSEKAQEEGQKLVVEKSIKLKGKGFVEISTTQLRRFFDDVKAMQRYLYQFQGKDREDAFQKKLPEIKMLKAKVSYARGRDTVTDQFQSFIESNVNAVNNLADFDVFCKYFEAVYGFFYFYSSSASAHPQKR